VDPARESGRAACCHFSNELGESPLSGLQPDQQFPSHSDEEFSVAILEAKSGRVAVLVLPQSLSAQENPTAAILENCGKYRHQQETPPRHIRWIAEVGMKSPPLPLIQELRRDSGAGH
jgi:hypothetical protein